MKRILLFCQILFPFITWSQEMKFPELATWQSGGKVQIFIRDNVYEHIDGASEFYLSYGFETLQVASWNNQGAELTIEVYDHGDPLHAYGIYSMEKSAKAESHPVGQEEVPGFLGSALRARYNLEGASGFADQKKVISFPGQISAKQ